MSPRMPQVSARELVQFLKSHGFAETRQRGSHLILRHPDRIRPVSVPMHAGSDMSRQLAMDILKQAGFSVEDYLRLR